MTNPVIGKLPCPMCEREATIHREKSGRRAYYFRCYAEDGSERCGTIQCRGPSGQVFIEKHARWNGPTDHEKVADEAAEQARESAQEESRREARANGPAAQRQGGGLTGVARLVKRYIPDEAEA